jgi:hypothetical protein
VISAISAIAVIAIVAVAAAHEHLRLRRHGGKAAAGKD